MKDKKLSMDNFLGVDEVSDGTQELSTKPVDMNSLLKKIDVSKTTDVFAATEKKRRSPNFTNNRTDRKTTIDGLLSKMMYEVVREVVREEIENLREEIIAEIHKANIG